MLRKFQESFVPPIIMKMQKFLPGKELVRDIYFHFTYQNNLGWKHTCVKSPEELKQYKLVNSDLAFLTLTKNPYSWLLSLYRKPYHLDYSDKPNFEAFLRRPWKTVGLDNVSRVLKNPIELWNIKNRSHLHLHKNKNSLNITTESIFENPKEIIKQISLKFPITEKSNIFLNYEKSTKDKSKDSNFYREYYLTEKWRDNLTREAIAIINETIDKELMSHFGYRLLP